MNFEAFVEKVKNNIKDYLADEYKDADVNVYQHEKINQSYCGLTVAAKQGMSQSPVVNLEDYYDDYTHGRSFHSIMGAIAETLEMEIPQVDISKITDYESAKDYLFIRVCNAENNKAYLQTVPHTMIEDMAITYHLRMSISINEMGVSSATITNQNMDSYGVSLEQLHEDALKNSEKVFPTYMFDLNETMKQEAIREMREEGMPEEMIEMFVSQMPSENLITVVTNDVKINGAAVIFYPETMEKMAQMVGGDYFILPSSVHETLILPDNGAFSAEELKTMVTDINQAEVLPEERLTNEVYHYDPIDKVFEKASSFEVRLAKRVETEKNAKKQSIMDKLGEKKEAARAMVGEKKTPLRTAEASL